MIGVEHLTFSLVEWLALTGLAQTLLILVYIVFRAGHFKQAVLAFTYFFVLAGVFLVQFSMRLKDFIPNLDMVLWLLLALGAPLSFLLIGQISLITKLPKKGEFLVLLFVPLTWFVIQLTGIDNQPCEDGVLACGRMLDWLYVGTAISGAISMLMVWRYNKYFEDMVRTKRGKERYWLILSLIVVNVALLGLFLFRSIVDLTIIEHDLFINTMGLVFAYLASTMLFRIYPQTIEMVSSRRRRKDDLSEEEENIAKRIRELMELDKLYHEPSFSRADLARELDVAENTISRIINQAFRKSFPVLINEHRVEDAKRMLDNSDIPIRTIAFEVGFNSLASFNRVFREITGQSPSSYRSGEPA